MVNVIVGVSGVALLTIGAIIGVYVWKNKTLEKYRKG